MHAYWKYLKITRIKETSGWAHFQVVHSEMGSLTKVSMKKGDICATTHGPQKLTCSVKTPSIMSEMVKNVLEWKETMCLESLVGGENGDWKQLSCFLPEYTNLHSVKAGKVNCAWTVDWKRPIRIWAYSERVCGKTEASVPRNSLPPSVSNLNTAAPVREMS